MDFSLLKQDVQNLCDRTGDAEERISTQAETVNPLSVTMRDTTSELAALGAKNRRIEKSFSKEQSQICKVPETCGGPPSRKISLFLVAGHF